MKLDRPWVYALLLAIIVGALLLAVGLGPDSLPFPPGSPYSDAVVSHWPSALFLQRSLQTGDWPLWRSLLMSGQPFAANPLNKVWYPPQWLVVLLPVTLHLNLLLWGHLVLAGVGMRAFTRRIGLKVGAASLTGLAYALTPRLIAAAGAGHLDIVYAIGWFPCVLWAIHNAIRGEAYPPRRGAILGLIAALCFLADIRLSVFIFATGAAFAAFLCFEPDRPRQVGQRRAERIALLTGSILLVALTAVQWLPLLQAMPNLSRNGLTVADAAVFSVPPVQLIGLILPRQPGSQETLLYAGIVILIMVIIGSVYLWRHGKRPFPLFWWTIILVGTLYAFGDQGFFWLTLTRLFPVLLWLRVPARIWIVVVLALIVLAGFGIQAILLEVRRPLLRSLLIVGFGAAIGLELLWTDVTRIEGRPRSQWLDAYAPLVQALQDSNVTRLYSPTYSLPQQAAAFWNIPTFGGVDPFQLANYLPDFESATGTKIKSYTVTLPPLNTDDYNTANRDAVINADQLARWNVSHVLSAYPLLTTGLTLVRQIDAVYLYVVDAHQVINLSWRGPNCFSADALNASRLPISVAAFAPGWTVPHDATALLLSSDHPAISGCYAPAGTLLAIGLSAAGLVAAGLALRVGKARLRPLASDSA